MEVARSRPIPLDVDACGVNCLARALAGSSCDEGHKGLSVWSFV